MYLLHISPFSETNFDPNLETVESKESENIATGTTSFLCLCVTNSSFFKMYFKILEHYSIMSPQQQKIVFRMKCIITIANEKNCDREIRPSKYEWVRCFFTVRVRVNASCYDPKITKDCSSDSTYVTIYSTLCTYVLKRGPNVVFHFITSFVLVCKFFLFPPIRLVSYYLASVVLFF